MMSAAAAMPNPSPSAAPWTCAMTGIGRARIAWKTGAKTSARKAWASSVSTSMFEMSRPELKTLPSPRMRSTRTLGIASATLATAAAISRRLSASRALRDSGPSRTISAIWPRLRNWISVMGAPLLLVMPVVDSPPVSGGVSPSVEALPGFSADLTGFDLVAQDLRRCEAGSEFGFEMLGDAQAHVEADDVRGLQRPDRVPVSQGHCPVDIGRFGHPFLDHPHRLECQSHAEAGGGEPGRVLDRDRRLAQSCHPALGDLDEAGFGVGADDDLDEFGHGDGVEEVEADERLRSRQPRGKFIDRQRRGVRADARGRSVFRDAGEDLLLESEVLGNGFDDEEGLIEQGGIPDDL